MDKEFICECEVIHEDAVNYVKDRMPDKDEYIEQKAREKGYAKEGEIVFYNISGSK